ncbi:MAG: sortase, partial [Chloroflexi bacterium]|nr:sortase [Chloroflexota bacterium]
VVVTDVISDGQHFDSSFAPTLQVDGNGYVLTAQAFHHDVTDQNYTVSCNYTGGPGAECDVDDAAANDGQTTITFRISDEILDQGQSSGNLLGGCINTAGGYLTPCNATNLNDGPTTATITFHTTIQEAFTDTYPSGDPSVDQGDLLSNSASVQGNVLDVTTFSPTGNTEADNAAASVSIERKALTKTIYALNGDTNSANWPTTADGKVEIKPNDEVTYRLTYDLNTSDVEDLYLEDYLPLPVFYVADPDADDYTAPTHSDGPAWVFDDVQDASVPAAGYAKFGPSDTFRAYSGIVPTLTSSSTQNKLTFTYGSYDDTRDQGTTVDLLFTVTATQDPFADLFFLTNEAHAYEGSTNAGTNASNMLQDIVLSQPLLRTTKSVIWSSNPSAIYDPTTVGPVTFLSPGNAPRWLGLINSTNLAASPIDSDISGIDAGDTVTFAIVIENTGSSLKGAFDLVIRDTFPSAFEIPTTPTGLNLQVYYGDGNGPITYNGLGGGPDGTNGTADDIFGSGIELVDPVGQGVCQVHDPNLGNNIILITYDLYVPTGITPGTFTNVGGLTHYAGEEGGPNHIPSTGTVFPDDYASQVWDESVQNTADVTVNAVPDKYLVATSEAHTSDPDVTIGEIVRYRLVVRIPEGTSPNFQVRDRLPGGLVFMNDDTATIGFVSSADNSITSSAVDAVPAIPNTCDVIGATADATTPPAPLPCTLADENIANTSDTTSNTDTYTSGTDVYFRLGDLVNTESDDDEEYVVIEFNALVHNQSTNQNDDGDTRTNLARAYINGSQSGDDSTGVDVTIVEPLLTLDKTNSTLSTTPAQTVDAGDTVTYTVTLDNLSANGSSADAFDIHFEDTLPVADLDLDIASVSVTGGTGVTNNSSDANNKVDIVIDEISLGSTVTITYDAVVRTTVTPSQAVDNTGDVTWTSLPGPAGTTGNSTGSDTPGSSGTDNGERDSSDGVGGATDDYAATDSSSFNVHDPLFSKSLEATSATHTTDPSVAIGEVATFGLYVTLSEGTTPSLQIVDDLPVGFDYVSGSAQVITQTSPPASCGSLAADFNGTLPVLTITAPGGSGADVTFDFGQITVADDNDTTNNRFLICFDALVLNEAGNQDGDTLTNSSTMQVGTNAPISSNDVDTNVVEPVLAIVKSVNDDQPASGQDIDFTLTVSHDGASTADAFDVNVTDSLPAGLDLDLASLNVTLAGGASGVTDNSSGNNIDIVISEIPLGGSVTVEFTANVSAAFGSNMTNQADVTWTSITGTDANERTGSGSGPNDYTASSTVDIGVYKRVLKSLIASNHATTISPDVTIGEILTYEVRLTIPPNDSDTYIVVDTLDSGLAFVDCSQITAAASVTSTVVDFTDVNNCNHGTVAGTNNPLIENSGGRVTFNFGTVTNTAGSFEDVVITYRVVVLDVIANLDSVTLSNNVEATWPSASQTRRATPDLAIIESDLLLEKTVDRTVVAPGSSVTYSLHVAHTADSHTSAYDLLITDVISDRLIIPPGGIVVVNESGQPFDRYNYDAATRTLTIEWDDFPFGSESVVSFTVQVGTLKPGASVINTANLAWTSLPGTPTAAAGQPPGVQSAYNSASTERRYDPTNQADFYGVQSSVVFSLPETGFAPGRVTIIPQQPRAKAYQDLGALWLEIPRLGVQLPIIGVPLGSDGWDLTWLWDQAGYLEGTAYPTWAGNTAITAHVYLPDGEPGPFVDLHTLQWGDQIILHANGQVYTYEVRETRRVRPNDISVLKHESYDWVTLITCQDYNEAQGTYAYRVVVRAVLLKVEAEFTPPLVGGR